MQMQDAPRFSTAVLTFSAASVSLGRPVIAMSAPRRANSIAVAEPMPPLPPVIRQTLLVRSMIHSLNSGRDRECPGKPARPPGLVLYLFGKVDRQSGACVHLPGQRLRISQQVHAGSGSGDNGSETQLPSRPG